MLRLKDQEFVQAARTLGAGNAFILFKEILPNITGTLITQIMVSIPGAIFLETFLSFVGLGLPLGSCSHGRLISEGFDNCLLHPYKLFPLYGDPGAADDRLQPRCRRPARSLRHQDCPLKAPVSEKGEQHRHKIT